MNVSDFSLQTSCWFQQTSSLSPFLSTPRPDATMQSLQQQREQVEIGAKPPKLHAWPVDSCCHWVQVGVCEDPNRCLTTRDWCFFFSFFLVDFWGMTCDLMEGSFYEESDSQISCIELKIWLAFRRHFISHMKSCPFTNRNSRCLLNATGGGINPPGFRMRRKFRGKSLSWSFQANLCKST